MADSVSTQRASGLGLRFIEDDPVTNAYRDSEKFDLQQRTGEAGLEGKNLENEYHGRSMGSRLRQVDATATHTELGNQYDASSMPARLRTVEATADQHRATADVATQTVPYKVSEAQSGARTSAANATAHESAPYLKVFELLDKGDAAAAHEYARANGIPPIPAPVVENAEIRGHMAALLKEGDRLYPQKPALRQKWLEGQVAEMERRKAAGEPIADQTAPYRMPEGAPPPVDTSGTHNYEMRPGTQDGVEGVWQHDRRTGERTFQPNATVSSTTGGARTGQTEKIISELRKENPSLSYAEALALTKRAPNADQATLRREALALSAAKADIDFITNPGGTLERYRKKYGLSAGPSNAPATPVPAPAQPAPPTPRPVTPAPQQPGGRAQIDQEGSLQAAREALQRNPAARDQIIQRLIENGIDPAGL